MSDWNPEHISAWETDRASSKEIDADDTELTRRAAAIRARDERIAELEAALGRAIPRIEAARNGDMLSGSWTCVADTNALIAQLKVALAGKEDS